MFTSNSHPAVHPSVSCARPIPTICVVDPRADDYRNSDTFVSIVDVKVQFVSSAEDALRIASTHAVDLWVVNTELPTLSGFELCSMLKQHQSAVCLVADTYSPVAEQAAWQARATLFTCKPTIGPQIEAWGEHWRAKHARANDTSRSSQPTHSHRMLAAR